MSAMPTHSALLRIEYPESDGKPLGETDVHRREILEIIAMLEQYYADHADVYISGNLMLYYEEGNPSAVVSPDVFVVKGVPKRERRVYKLWEEGYPPTVVFEITSRSTRLEDRGMKRQLFAELGVREYVLFDPLSEYLKPPLQGFRLIDDELVPLEPEANSSLISKELGLRLLRDGSYLRLIDLANGQQLLRPAELDKARRVAEAKTHAEAEARRAAEAKTHAEAEARRAAEARARAAEQEVERLRAELARLRAEQ